jgi:hypothetical protein
MSELDILKVIKRLKLIKSVDTPGVITKGSCTVFAPLLRYILDFSLLREYFRNQRTKSFILGVLEKGNSPSVRNYKKIYLLNNFSEVLEFVVDIYIHIFLKIN